MNLEIRPIRGADERLAVQRQRHAIFVEELGYANPNAAAGERLVADALDDTGLILAAFDGPVLAGSVRINFGQLGDYAQLDCIRRFGPYCPDRLTLITKLVIAPAYRAGTLMTRFGLALYLLCRDEQPATRFGVISCIPAHVPLFERMGYRQIGEPVAHPAAGISIPMATVLYDLHHFQRIGCPLARLCPRHDEESSDWFAREFAQQAVVPA